jgi:hypothetical protein
VAVFIKQACHAGRVTQLGDAVQLVNPSGDRG